MIIREILKEHVINAFTPEQKARYADEVWDILMLSYSKVEGGFGSAANVEELINTPGLWKIVRRNGKITAVNIYRGQHGRKSIASGTDGTSQGKKDYLKIKDEDIIFKRSWGEVSGAVEAIMRKSENAFAIPNKFAHYLTKKEILDYNPDGIHYTRLIAGKPHEKVIYGFINPSADLIKTLADNNIDVLELPLTDTI